MAEEKPTVSPERPLEKKKMPGKWFRKVPKGVLFSPGGIILIFLAIIFEISDPLLPGGALTVEIIPDLIFAFFLIKIAKVPWQSTAIPFLIERIPLISDISPTWLIKLFGLF